MPKSTKPIGDLKANTSVTSEKAAQVKGGTKSNIPMTMGDESGTTKGTKSGTLMPPPPPPPK